MTFKIKATGKEFSSPVELTDDWLLEHEPHGLMWSIHTVFTGKRGIKYRECRCYKCRTVAQIKLEDVSTEPVPHEPEKRRRGRQRKTYEDFDSSQDQGQPVVRTEKDLEKLHEL